MGRRVHYNLKVSYSDGYSFIVRENWRVISSPCLSEITKLQSDCAWPGAEVSIVEECNAYAQMGWDDKFSCPECLSRDSCIRVTTREGEPRYSPNFYSHVIRK